MGGELDSNSQHAIAQVMHSPTVTLWEMTWKSRIKYMTKTAFLVLYIKIMVSMVCDRYGPSLSSIVWTFYMLQERSNVHLQSAAPPKTELTLKKCNSVCKNGGNENKLYISLSVPFSLLSLCLPPLPFYSISHSSYFLSLFSELPCTHSSPSSICEHWQSVGRAPPTQPPPPPLLATYITASRAAYIHSRHVQFTHGCTITDMPAHHVCPGLH